MVASTAAALSAFPSLSSPLPVPPPLPPPSDSLSTGAGRPALSPSPPSRSSPKRLRCPSLRSPASRWLTRSVWRLRPQRGAAVRRDFAQRQGHRRKVPADLCASVKVAIGDEETPDQTAHTNAWKSWMEEHMEATGKAPPGNVAGNYTWVGAPQRPPDLRLMPGRHVLPTVPLEQLIDQLVKENKVVAFIKGSRSAPQCGFSQRVVGILEAHGVDFVTIDVLDEEHNPGLRETLKTYSHWPTFPQLFVGGELEGGCDIVSSMAEKGELAALFQKLNSC
ncbi:hypothetical protein EJB05_30159 [Eragrostis curvula]|uniref:Glutaredoxin domain-containing protein n=1 Tax=Eragrostis curvula TaxID=38414 RepID=A0A5J9UWW4_9POAL|nr:hypothetical protein EJB05_30159 [Eragrostis curvula]